MTRGEAAARARAAKKSLGKPAWNKGLKGDPRLCKPHPGLCGRIPWNKGLKGLLVPWNKGRRDPDGARRRGLRYSRSEKGRSQYRRSRWDGNWLRAIESSGGICETCGGVATRVHHKDGRGSALRKDERNDSLDNLIALCEPCHRMTHRAIKRGLPPVTALDYAGRKRGASRR